LNGKIVTSIIYKITKNNIKKTWQIAIVQNINRKPFRILKIENFCDLEFIKIVSLFQNYLIEKKIVLVLRAELKTDMYKEPLYGKEWHWRNVKMEALELHIILRS